MVALTKRVQVPEGGWTAESFSAHGSRLIFTLSRFAKIIQRRAFPVVARKAAGLFRSQIEKVFTKVLSRAGTRSAKGPDDVQIDLGVHEAIWQQAIDEVFREEEINVVTEIVPPVQSVMAQGFSQTSTLLGLSFTRDVSQLIARESRDVASRIVGINSSTRKQFMEQVLKIIEEGMTVVEAVNDMRRTFPKFSQNRIATIARTELQNAWTAGSIRSFNESPTLTHVSVIGCESRERDRWGSPSYQQYLYNGESTCNIQDVPVHDADKLRWHPNHTGTLIPSRFRNADGTVEAIED